MKEKKPLVDRQWWSMLLLGAILLLIYHVLQHVGVLWRGFGQLLDILAPFIAGFVMAFLLYRPCAQLEAHFRKSRFRIFRNPARGWSITIVYVALLGIIALAGVVIVPLIIQGVSGLIASLPTYYEQALAFAHRQQPLLDAMHLDVSELLQSVYDAVRNYFTMENVLSYLSGLMSVTSSFLNATIAFIISIYMIASRESLLHSLRRLADAVLPGKAVALTAHYSHKASDIFTQYVYSLLLDALIICVMAIPGLYIAGMPSALAFAVFIGICNLIPYFGSIVSGVVCVAVLVLGGHLYLGIFLAVYLIVIQQIDGNIIKPRIFGQSVGIEPLYVLLAIIVGGGIAGLLGMLIGVPVVAVLKILVSDFITHRDRIKRERAAQPPASVE